jgi:hypothetical protein
MADFLVALADFDRRRAWAELGYASLFAFLHRELALSNGAAHYRKVAAQLVQRFPEVVEPLRDGRLCITSVVHLAKVLTPENRQETLPKFFQCSRRESMAVAAALQPATAAPHRDVVTAVRPAAATCMASVPAPEEPAAPSAAPAVQPAELELPPPSLLPKPARRDAAEPLTSDLSRLHVTVSRRFLEKLEAARAALSHALPLASAEDILEAGLDLVLERHAKRKGLVQKPRQQTSQKENPTSAGSHIPAAVKREVWKRDGGRCQWPVESGGVCGSTLRVQFGHKKARALGGRPTADNLHLLCAFHNDLDARQTFGDEKMNQFTRGPAQEEGFSQPGAKGPPS